MSVFMRLCVCVCVCVCITVFFCINGKQVLNNNQGTMNNDDWACYIQRLLRILIFACVW